MYTKGKWEAISWNLQYPKYEMRVYAKDRGLIARIDTDTTLDFNANARLISAAPDMYRLLKEIYEAELNADVIRILSPWFDKVEQALAKAEGKQ